MARFNGCDFGLTLKIGNTHLGRRSRFGPRRGGGVLSPIGVRAATAGRVRRRAAVQRQRRKLVRRHRSAMGKIANPKRYESLGRGDMATALSLARASDLDLTEIRLLELGITPSADGLARTPLSADELRQEIDRRKWRMLDRERERQDGGAPKRASEGTGASGRGSGGAAAMKQWRGDF